VPVPGRYGGTCQRQDQREDLRPSCLRPGPASPSPATTLTACTIDGGIAADCGNVWVPQDWAHPDRPAMPLQVVVLPATGTSHPAAPLFYLAGYNGDAAGFGDAVLNGLSWAAQAFRQLNQTMDLVFVEQRGTSGSGLQTCSGSQPATTVDPAAISAALRRCLAGVTRDPRHDTTTSAVRDLDQVRSRHSPRRDAGQPMSSCEISGLPPTRPSTPDGGRARAVTAGLPAGGEAGYF
jgi:hypothetical protein